MALQIEFDPNFESPSPSREIESQILKLEKEIITMSKRPSFYSREIAAHKVRIKALRRNHVSSSNHSKEEKSYPYA